MLITNIGNAGHAKAILEILKGADKIWIAVAFLKRGGTDLIVPILKKCLAGGATVELFVGTDYFHTDPKALEELLELKKRYPECSVLVADRAPATFHPKVYVSCRGDTYRSLIGSANLTLGALGGNEELSVALTHRIDDPVIQKLEETFARYRTWVRLRPLDLLLLQQYSSAHAIDRDERNKYEKARDAAMPAAFDLRVIDERYAEYRADNKAMSDLAERKVRRAQALKVQKAIVALGKKALDRAAKGRFRDLLRDLMSTNEGRHLWGSSNIHRQGSQALNHPDKTIAICTLARSIASRPRLEGYATIKKACVETPGVGLNFATEILCTFAPARWAVYNGNTAAALKALGITAPAHANFDAISAVRYDRVCSTIEALGARIGAADLSDADAFLNWIYDKWKRQR